MDQKICSLADRQAKNKRKLDDTSMNNQNQQQPFKRHNVARAYTAGPALGLLPRLLIQWECLGLPMWPVVMSEVPRWPSRRNSCVERLEFTLSSLLQVKMRGKE
ncbi:hypothetical protein Tco_1384242 [Tanacetum coccineum]